MLGEVTRRFSESTRTSLDGRFDGGASVRRRADANDTSAAPDHTDFLGETPQPPHLGRSSAVGRPVDSVPMPFRSQPPSPKPRRIARLRRPPRFLFDALLGAGLMVVLHLFVIQVSVVKGNSMEPCLHDGDRLVVDRVAYNLAEVGRGDVVVLRYPKDPTLEFVKRIVGLPGDRVAMQHGTLLVNGEPSDSYGAIADRQDLPEFVVPEGRFFVLGDNRPISCDSREFGLVPQELLKGRVRARFWPLATASVF